MQILFCYYCRSYITRGIFRLMMSEKPQFTDVNEDFEKVCNAEITLLCSFLLIHRCEELFV